MERRVLTSDNLHAVETKRDRGFILVAALLMLVGLMALASVATRGTQNSANHVRHDYHEEQVFQVADGGADVAEKWLLDLLDTIPNPTQTQLDAIAAPSLPYYSFSEYSITKEPFEENTLITKGQYAGVRANVQPFTIRSHAVNSNSTSEKTVEITMYQFWVNLGQYGIFYDGDLELFPDNPSTFTGRIHSNGNVYLGSNSSFDIIGHVTAAGHIYNTPKDPTMSYNGKARILDNINVWHDLSYDWRDPNWLERSLNDWDGLVMDSAHGVEAEPMPVNTLPIPIDLIKRGQFGDDMVHRMYRYYYRAGLKIVDGNATDSLGNPRIIPAGVIRPDTVYDCREGHDMAIQEINMGLLFASGLVPSNKIIYISYSAPNSGVRIVNGTVLPTGGLLIATDNPLYVQGDFNTINMQPCTIFCDAFNCFSNAWADANASRPLNQRLATSTTINTCIVAGDKRTTDGHYSGGAGNLIRLHERWLANQQLSYSGSLACLWESEQAVGDYDPRCCNEHHRDSHFDPALLDPEFWPEYGLRDHSALRMSWRSE